MLDTAQALSELMRRIAYSEEQEDESGIRPRLKQKWDKYELLSFIMDFKHEVQNQKPHPQANPFIRLAWGRREIRVFFAWFDLWVGAYWSAGSQTLYLCPLPCCVIALMPREVEP